MYSKPIYFDNAATTFPKPESVIMSVLDCIENYCGNPGRGSHTLAMKSSEKVFEAREAVANLFSASPENVIFTLNTTYALNTAIKGVMRGGGHILISNMEHNSVLRPVEALKNSRGVYYDTFNAYNCANAKSVISEILRKLRNDTKMLICTHASNICSFTHPIREIGQLCHRYGIIFCVDAAQSAGHIPIDMREDCIDILCAPGHKGLYSPQGCGIMILREGLEIGTLAEGGNGVNSLDLSMGHESPERYEGGTLCTPAIVGLTSGIEFVKSIGLDYIAEHEKKLWNKANSMLSDHPNITVYDNTEGSVLLFNITGVLADDTAKLLADKGFCLRSGYHCSPLAHKTLKTPSGGAVRVGFGIFKTEEQVELLCKEIYDISRTI